MIKFIAYPMIFECTAGYEVRQIKIDEDGVENVLAIQFVSLDAWNSFRDAIGCEPEYIDYGGVICLN